MVFSRFLLAHIHLETLAEFLTDNEIMRACASLPESVDETYARLLQRTKASIETRRDSKIAFDRFQKILGWVAGAIRPLKLAELAEAISLTLGQNSLKEGEIINDPKGLLTMCGPLLRVDDTNEEVYFCHFSLKEFLTSGRCTRPILLDRERTEETGATNIDVNIFHLELSGVGGIHGWIAEFCLTYLCFDNFNIPYSDGQDFFGKRQQYAFLDYATLYAGEHCALINDLDDGLIDRLLRLLDRLFVPEFDEHTLSYSRVEGMLCLVSCPLVGFDDEYGHYGEPGYRIVWNQDGLDRASLRDASIKSTQARQLRESETIWRQWVRNLTGILVDSVLNKSNLSSEMPLSLLPDFEYCYLDLVGKHQNCINWIQLYRYLAPVTRRDHQANITPLYFASLFGWKAGVQQLINRHSGRQIWRSDLNHALRGASIQGDVEIIEELVKRGAEVRANFDDLGSALQSAAYCGKKDAVMALYRLGAPIEEDEPFYRPGGTIGGAYQAAVIAGNQDLVLQLMQLGADFNSTRGWTGHPLSNMISASTHEMAKLILSQEFNGEKVRPDTVGGYWVTPLHACASVFGEETCAVMRAMQPNVRDPDATKYPYGTALQLACYRNNGAMVHELLSLGSKVNAQAGLYGTAIQSAAMGRYPSALARLLEQPESDPCCVGTMWDFSSATKIEYWGSYYILQGGKGLIDDMWHGPSAQSTQEDIGSLWNTQFPDTLGFYGPLISSAVRVRSDRWNQVLVVLEQEPTHRNGHLGNPLQAAAYYGAEESVRRLLQHKTTDIHTVNGVFGTALNAAAYQGWESVVQILLSQEDRPCVNAFGGFFGLPLLAAAAAHQTDVAKLLVRKGADPLRRDEHGWCFRAWAYHTRNEVLYSASVLQIEGPENPATQPKYWDPAKMAPQLKLFGNGRGVKFLGKSTMRQIRCSKHY